MHVQTKYTIDHLKFHQLLSQPLHSKLVAGILGIACLAFLLQDGFHSLHLSFKPPLSNRLLFQNTSATCQQQFLAGCWAGQMFCRAAGSLTSKGAKHAAGQGFCTVVFGRSTHTSAVHSVVVPLQHTSLRSLRLGSLSSALLCLSRTL